MLQFNLYCLESQQDEGDILLRGGFVYNAETGDDLEHMYLALKIRKRQGFTGNRPVFHEFREGNPIEK